jgi:hypothetical protein
MFQTTAQSMEVYRMTTIGLCQCIQEAVSQSQRLSAQISSVEHYIKDAQRISHQM